MERIKNIPRAPIPVILDSDGGVDSCDALWWGLTSSEVDILAVCAENGVVSAAQGARNFAKVLHAAGRPDIPLAIGSEEKLGPAPVIPPATLVHGDDGLGNTNIPDAPFGPSKEPAVDLILRLCAEQQGEIVLAALGPFGNVAQALRRRPELVHQVRDLLIMGGAANPPGNATATGEFNIVFDPTAAAEMVLAPWPRPPLMVGLDVTYKATLSAEEFAVLNARCTPAASFMAAPFNFYRQREGLLLGEGTCASHGTLTLMSVAHPELLTTEVLPLTVDTGGSAAWGQTIVDFRARRLARLPEAFVELARNAFFDGKAPWRIALDIDVEGFRTRIRRFYGG